MKHIFALILLVIILTLSLVACGDKTNNADDIQNSIEDEPFTEFQWPKSEIAKLLPVPESNIGKIEWEASYGFVIYVGETSQKTYDFYVNKCSENGFTVDYQKGDDYYYADNEDGYHLSLNYEGNNTMFIRIDEPKEIESNSSQVNDIEETNDKNTNLEKPSSEFKEAMDSYEAFFDDYIAFMNKYKESTNTASMLSDYTNYLKQYTEMMEKMNSIDKNSISSSDLIYYSEVTIRIMEKLSTIN